MNKRHVQNTNLQRIIKKADCMRTKAYRKKLMADLKLATQNCIESVENTHMQKKNCWPVLAIFIFIVSQYKVAK